METIAKQAEADILELDKTDLAAYFDKQA